MRSKSLKRCSVKRQMTNKASQARRSLVLSAAAVAAVVSGFEKDSRAASPTWNNTGTDFNTGADWTGGTGTGGIPGTGDNATFSSAKVTNPNLSASLTIQGLTFSTTAASGYTLSNTNSAVLTLTNIGTGASAAINAANTSGTNTISAPLILGGTSGSDAAFTQAAGGTLVLSGAISSTSDEGVLINGAGTVQFSANNSYYAGGTLLNAGTLSFSASSNLSTGAVATPFGTGAINLGGGTLQLLANGSNDSTFQLFQVPNSLVLSSNSSFLSNRTSQGGNKFFQVNSLDLGANTLTVSSGNGYNLAVAGVTKGLNGASISDTGSTSNNGLSAVNLNALTVSNAAPTATNSIITLNVSNASVPINIYGRVTDNAADATKTLGILKTGNATSVLNLYGNNSFSGGLSSTGGIVRLYNANALGTGNTNLNGTVIEGTRDYTSFTQTLGAGPGQLQFSSTTSASGFGDYGANVTVNLNSGAGLVWNSTTGFNLGTGNFILNGTDIGSSPTGNGTLTFQNALNLNSASAARVIETDGGTANISGNITNSAGTAALTKAGGNIGNVGVAYDTTTTGVLILSGTNTFNGQINLTAGELSFATQANVGTGNIAFAGGGLQYTGTGAITLTNSYSTGNNNFGFDITSATGSLTVSSNLSPGGNSFFKYGPGTLNYSGNNFNTTNFFDGSTSQLSNQSNGTINITTPAPSGNVAGSLQMTNGAVNFTPSGSASTALYNFSSALTFNRAAAIGLTRGSVTTETLNFSNSAFSRSAAGSTLSFAPNGGFATFGTSEKVTVGSTPTLNSNAAAVGTLNPSIIVRDTSANNLNADFVSIATSGTTLFNANSASATAVSKDTTSANGTTFNTANPGSSKLEYVNSGISVSGQTTATVGALVNAGTITIANASTLTVGDNTSSHQAGLILNGGTIAGGGSTATLAFGSDEGVVSFNSQSTNAISSVISGSGGLTFNGASGGTFTLGSANANSYSGTTTINGGTVKLAASSSSALGAANNTLTINAGTLDLNGNSTPIIANLNGTPLATITNSGTAATLNIGTSGQFGSIFSGAITGSNLAVTKGNSNSTIVLDGANSYGGITTINNGGINFGNNLTGLSANSAILLGNNFGNTGSFIEGNGTFNAALGTSAGQIKFVASGNTTDSAGFAAYGGPLTVNIGGAGATLTWNSTANFLTSNNLFFGNTQNGGNGVVQSDNKVTFVNGLDINGGNRTVTVNTINYNSGVNQGQYGLDSVLLSGNLTDAAGSATINADSFTKTGNISSALMQLSGTASNLKNAKFNAGTGTTEFLSGASLTTKGSLNITDKVIVDNGATVTFGGDNTSANANYVGNNSSAQNTLQIDGGTANFNNSTTGTTGNGWLFGGANGSGVNGEIDITAGTLNVGTFLSLAGTPSATAGSAPTGNNSTFSLNIDGGTVTVGGGTGSVGTGVNGALYLKGNSSDTTATGGQAIVNLNGGTLALTQVIIGGGTGSQSVFNLNGGTLQADASSTTFLANSATSGTSQVVVESGGAIVNTNTFNDTISANLLGAPNDGGLTKNGAGTLSLTGVNTYAGGTFINAGTLNVNSDTAMGTAPASAVTNITFTGNSTLQFGANFNPSANRNVAINSGVTATIDTNNNSPIMGSAIGGSGNLIVTNSHSSPAGSLTLSGLSSYSGTTTIASAGILNVTGKLGATATTVQNGGTLTGAGTSSTTGIIGGAVTVNGGAVINAAAALSTNSLTANGLTLGNSSTYTAGQYATTTFALGTGTNVEAINVGTFGASNGTLTLNSSGDFVNITGTATSGSTYVLMNYGSETLNGAFSLSSTTAGVTSETVGRQSYALSDSGTQLTLGVTGAAVPTVAYWYGGAGTTVWDDTTTSATKVNWSTDLAGTMDAGNTPGAITDVILNASNQIGTVTTTLGQNTTINSLTVNGNGTNTINADANGTNPNGAATSTTDALTINAAAINGDTQGNAITVGSAANAFTINAPLVMGNSGASQTWTNASANAFTVGGTVTGTSTTGNVQTLNLVNSSTGGTTISGVISDVTGGGQVAVVVNNTGSGTTTLQANNTFTGGLTLTAGTLSRAGGTGTSFGAGNITVNGGTMDLYGAVGFVLNNLSGSGGDITSSFSTNNTSLNLTNTANTTFAGTIDGNVGSGITKSGAGTLALTGSNSYGGSTTLTGGILQANTANSLGATAANAIFNGGTLQLLASYATSRNFVVDSGQNALIDTQGFTLTDSGVISTSSGTGGLTKLGSGTLVLNNTETYNGITTITNGTIQLGASGVLPANTLAGGANLVLNSTGTTGTLDLNSKSITLTAAPTGTGGVITNTQNGTTSTLTIGTGSTSVALNDTTGGGSGTGVLAVVVTGNAVTLNNAASNYTGGTTINNGGQLNISGNQVGSGTITVGSTVGGSGALNLTSGATVTDYANNFILNGGSISKQNNGYVLGSTTSTVAVNGATTINSNFGYGGAANFTGGAGKPFEIDGILSGSAALTINGIGNGFTESSGVFITNNSNSYSGTITVNANSGNGVDLTIGGNTALQNATINVVGVSTNTGQVPYGLAFTGGTSSGSNGNFTVASSPVIGALSGSGNIALQTWNGNALFTEGQGAAVALTTGGNNANTTFSGILSGTGSVTKTGTGTMTLSNASDTYTGSTTIASTGTLKLAATSTNNIAKSGAITVGSGATLDVTGLSSGTIVLSSGQVLGGSGTVSGATTVASGSTISAGTSTALGTGASTANGTLATGGQAWNAAGKYSVKITDPTGTAGAGTGWDNVTMTALSVSGTNSASLSTAFNIDPVGTLTGVAVGTSWAIAQTTASQTLVNGSTDDGASIATAPNLLTDGSNAFALDTSNFSVNGSGLGVNSQEFSLELVQSVSGDTLNLVYNATPEPGTAMLVLAGAVPMLRRRRRRVDR
jgi:fibronectin-binding autotransporter adhesin